MIFQQGTPCSSLYPGREVTLEFEAVLDSLLLLQPSLVLAQIQLRMS